MTEELLNGYIKLINKGYCEDCNELNCIGNFPHKKIANAILDLQQERDKYKYIVDSIKDYLVKEISRMDDLINKGNPKPYGTEKQYYETCKCRYVDVLTKVKELEEGEINENE